MTESVLITAGIIFISIGAAGIMRMPDIFTRLSVVTKGVTFGIGFILLGAAMHFNDTGVLIKVIIIYTFLAVSTSVSASVIGITAYRDKKTRSKIKVYKDELNESDVKENTNNKVE